MGLVGGECCKCPQLLIPENGLSVAAMLFATSGEAIYIHPGPTTAYAGTHDAGMFIYSLNDYDGSVFVFDSNGRKVVESTYSGTYFSPFLGYGFSNYSIRGADSRNFKIEREDGSQSVYSSGRPNTDRILGNVKDGTYMTAVYAYGAAGAGASGNARKTLEWFSVGESGIETTKQYDDGNRSFSPRSSGLSGGTWPETSNTAVIVEGDVVTVSNRNSGITSSSNIFIGRYADGDSKIWEKQITSFSGTDATFNIPITRNSNTAFAFINATSQSRIISVNLADGTINWDNAYTYGGTPTTIHCDENLLVVTSSTTCELFNTSGTHIATLDTNTNARIVLGRVITQGTDFNCYNSSGSRQWTLSGLTTTCIDDLDGDMIVVGYNKYNIPFPT